MDYIFSDDRNDLNKIIGILEVIVSELKGGNEEVRFYYKNALEGSQNLLPLTIAMTMSLFGKLLKQLDV